MDEVGNPIPKSGEWPVDPQEDQPLHQSRIWIDGVFDFFHHGHAGVMLQARQLGTELYIGIHSDEACLENKGPTVMNLRERVLAASACRWTTHTIPSAPYVTSLPWISHYGCHYVVHGDDITSDSSGLDCYRFVKSAGRFKVVKRTPGISTTDLVGRMLLCTKGHFVGSLRGVLEGREGEGEEGNEERKLFAQGANERVKSYASDESGFKPGVAVYDVQGREGAWSISTLVEGKQPRPGQRIVYVDGGFDLFSSGHIEFLRCVVAREEKLATEAGWYSEEAKRRRGTETGEDYGPCYVVAGVHDDAVVNEMKGLNYPIMNVVERGLCVLQCKYIHTAVFSAPYAPTQSFLSSLPHGIPAAVYHGPTSLTTLYPNDNATHSNHDNGDPYSAAKELGIYHELPPHDFQDVNAAQIVRRIMDSRERFEERQRRKGVKSLVEAEARRVEVEKEGVIGS